MTKPLRRSTGWIAASALTILALALAGSVQAPASTSILPPGALAPTDAQRMTARKVGRLLEEYHYSHLIIDDKMSAQIFQRYLDFLDGQRSYFLASDIADFSVYRYQFDDMIRTGEIDPAYLIFNRFQQRNRERLRYAIALLNTEPDFTINETYTFDRTHAPWATSTAELNDLWRKKVKQDALSLMLDGKTWPQAAEILRKRYQRVLKSVDQVETEDVFEGLMNAYTRSFDPHSTFFSPRGSEEYRIQMSLNYEGIGASLQLSQDGYVTILNVIPGGPAAVAGTLKPNDRIVGVGQGKTGPFTDVIGWRLDDVVQLIRGPGGSVVRLQVLPAGAAPGSPDKTLEFVRNKVTLESQAAHKEVKTVMRNGRLLKVGIITVPGFYQDIDAENAGDPNYRSTTRDVRKLIEELKIQGIDGLILDLREDGGGYLPEATALTGLFIDHGPVVQLREASGRIEVLDDPDPGPVYDGPLAVLVDRYSASASEIFAAAIKDYHRGLIIGQRTFGKGTVQNLMPLERWPRKPTGQLTITIGKFYRVTGQSTQHRGVIPDIPLPSPIDITQVGESALQAALPWDRIAGVPFELAQGATAVPPIAPLLADEKAREQHDPDFRWYAAELKAEEALRDEHSISLNLKVRRAERDREDRARLVRENARRVAEGLPRLKSVADLDKAKDPPDVVLAQAAQIMGDMVVELHPALVQNARRF